MTGSCKGDSGGLVDYQKVSYDSLFDSVKDYVERTGQLQGVH